MPYDYVTSVNRYRDSDTGRFVPRETVMGYVSQIIEAGQKSAKPLSQLVTDGTISPDDFGVQLKGEFKSSYIQDYILGRGGRDLMEPTDWGHIGALLKEQYGHVDGFVADLKSKPLSQAQVEARSNLYFQRSRQAFEIGHSRAYGVPKLPAYPGDMTTLCKGGCQCFWDITTLDGDGNADCDWILESGVENCDTCVERAASWGIEVRGGVIQPFRDIKADVHVHGEIYEHSH